MIFSKKQKGKIDVVMLMLSMLLVVTALSLFQYWQTLEKSQQHNFDNVELISLSHNVLHDNNYLIKYIRLYILSRDTLHREVYLKKLNDYASFFGRLERMREIGLTKSEEDKIARIKSIWANLERTEADALAAMNAQEFERAVGIVYGQAYLQADSMLVATFQDLINEIELRGKETTVAMNERVELIMIVFSSAFLIIVAILALSFRKITALREHAERSSKYKSAFLANMSHEIRTPMNAILGITEIQLRDGCLPKEMEEALNEVYNSGTLLLNIINDILDLSKIEAGKFEIIPVKYDLPSLINDTVQVTCLRYDSKSIGFHLDVDENAPLNLVGDVLRLKQILNNVLSNAFKYTDSGEVRLSISFEKNTDTTDAAAANDVTLIFKVTDTGQGMTAEQLKNLFDEYTRFNMEANRTTVGTGLGMSITKRLVGLLEGDIQVESVAGKGTVFTIRVPQRRADARTCGKETVEKLSTFRFRSAGVSNKIRMLREYMPYGSVLVVDDVKSNIFVAKGMLMPYGLKVDTATSGAEAIEKVKAGNVYDIIFMDHMMPEMDGVEAVKIIRGMGYTQSIVALTANALVGQADIFLQNGFDGYLSKPVDSRELNLVLNELIRDKKPAEVIKAARRERMERELSGADLGDAKGSFEKSNAAEKFFILDAESTVNVLERILSESNEIGDAQIKEYEVAVHGIKSVLKNIGETALSEDALKLEKAASAGDVEAICNDTPVLVESLKALIEKFKLPESAGAKDSVKLTNESAAFLREKLTVIKTACEKFDTNTANAALNDLMSRDWPLKIENVLDDLSINLMHSDFDKVHSGISTGISLAVSDEE